MNGDVPAASWEGRSARDWQIEWRVPEAHLLARASSSNDVAARLADAGAPPGTTVITEVQTAGRGRAGRSWAAAPGQSVLLSVLLHAEPGIDPGTAPLRVGLAAALAIEQVAGIDVRIKWPNDLLLPDGRKLGGILCEAASRSAGTRIVAGIGINVRQEAHDFPEPLRALAGSLHLAGPRPDRAAIVGAILDRLRPFRVLPPPLDAQTLRALAARDALRGWPVEIDGTMTGLALGIAPDGSLVVRVGDRAVRVRTGSVRRTFPGTATHPAAADPDSAGSGMTEPARTETPR